MKDKRQQLAALQIVRELVEEIDADAGADAMKVALARGGIIEQTLVCLKLHGGCEKLAMLSMTVFFLLAFEISDELSRSDSKTDRVALLTHVLTFTTKIVITHKEHTEICERAISFLYAMSLNPGFLSEVGKVLNGEFICVCLGHELSDNESYLDLSGLVNTTLVKCKIITISAEQAIFALRKLEALIEKFIGVEGSEEVVTLSRGSMDALQKLGKAYRVA